MFREGFEPDIYRDNLAEEIKKSSKEERKEILEQAKQTKEYQVARNKKIEEREKEGEYEEEIDDGLGVFVKKKTLYHGSGKSEIKEFRKADDTTVGDGVYLTSKANDAIGYSHERGKKEHILYETIVENIKLLDFRGAGNIEKIMPGYKKVLERKAEEILEEYSYRGKSIPHMVASRRNFIKGAIKFIDEGKLDISTIQQATLHIDDIFTDYVKSLKYDGLITIEGGEGRHKGNHDSYVIFDPKKIKIVREQEINKEINKNNV